MNSRKRLLMIIAVLLGIWAAIAPSLALDLIVERPIDRADAIIVLSGSAVYRERTAKAAELYSAGVSPQIYISDDGAHAGWIQNEETNLPFVELERRELVAHGVPTDAIITLPGTVSGTDDEAKALKREIEFRTPHSAFRTQSTVLIVTSAYHSRRALRTFENILARHNVDVGIVTAPPGIQTPGPNCWWLSPRGWQTVAGEYVKSAVYYAYY